jgi:hypothetical protein
MANAAKIACSIDADLLHRVESVRARTGETRSAFISRTLIALTAESARASSVKRYVEAYKDHPEGPADLAAARKSARRALSRVTFPCCCSREARPMKCALGSALPGDPPRYDARGSHVGTRTSGGGAGGSHVGARTSGGGARGSHVGARTSGGDAGGSHVDTRMSGGDAGVLHVDTRTSGGGARVSHADTRMSGGDAGVSHIGARTSGGDQDLAHVAVLERLERAAAISPEYFVRCRGLAGPRGQRQRRDGACRRDGAPPPTTRSLVVTVPESPPAVQGRRGHNQTKP